MVFLLSLLHYINSTSEKVTHVKEYFISKECNVSNVLLLSEFCCLIVVPAPLGQKDYLCFVWYIRLEFDAFCNLSWLSALLQVRHFSFLLG